MSYCRWSSDCFTSDVYVYESNEGFMIHVATSKYVSETPRPVRADKLKVLDYISYFKDCEDWVKTAHLQKIGLPMDGKSYYCLETPNEAADKLEELRTAGYCIPQYAIDTLREESEKAEK